MDADFAPCPTCGAARPVHALDLCPACLLRTALETPGSVDDEPCPYEVLSPVGHDQRGVTYLARHAAGRTGYVALKVHAPREDAAEVLARYAHWKPTLDALAHPAVNPLIDIGLTADGRLYVATPFVAGWPLSTIGARRSPGDSVKTEIGRQLAAAVAAAHSAGITHLALDASKVKITTAGGPHVVVLGFGLAGVVEGATGGPEADRAALARIVHDLGVGGST